MSNVIWSPGTNHNIGPGVSLSTSNSGPVVQSEVLTPSLSGSANLKTKYEDDNVRNLKVNSAFDFEDYLSSINRMSDKQLQKYMDYNREMYHEARQWEKDMSDTAIRRQMADLKAAGLNPILATNFGGASTPSTNVPYSSISPTSAFGSAVSGASSLVGSMMSRASAYDVAELNSRTAIVNTNLITAREYRLADMANSNAVYIHQLDNSAKASLETALQSEQFKHDFDMLDEELSQWQLKNNAGNTSTLPGLVQNMAAKANDLTTRYGEGIKQAVFNLLGLKYNVDLYKLSNTGNTAGDKYYFNKRQYDVRDK